MLIAIKPVVVVLGGQPSPKFSFGWSPGGVGLHPHERIENEDLTLGKLMQKGAEKKEKKTWLPLEHDMQTLVFPHRPVSLQSGIALEKIIKAGSPSPTACWAVSEMTCASSARWAGLSHPGAPVEMERCPTQILGLPKEF